MSFPGTVFLLSVYFSDSLEHQHAALSIRLFFMPIFHCWEFSSSIPPCLVSCVCNIGIEQIVKVCVLVDVVRIGLLTDYLCHIICALTFL